MTDTIPADIPASGPTAEQIRFAKRVLWSISGTPPEPMHWYGTPEDWQGLKELLQWAATEADNKTT